MKETYGIRANLQAAIKKVRKKQEVDCSEDGNYVYELVAATYRQIHLESRYGSADFPFNRNDAQRALRYIFLFLKSMLGTDSSAF